MVPDFSNGGRHLVIDGVVTTVHRNTILGKVSAIPRFPAKQVEDKKFKADADSATHVSIVHGVRHRLIPFAMEDGGSREDWSAWPSYPENVGRVRRDQGEDTTHVGICQGALGSGGSCYVDAQVAAEAFNLVASHPFPPCP